MKTLFLLIAIITSLFTSLPIFAADDAKAAGDPGTVAEKFYAGYVAQVEANKDTKKWVAGSKLVTANFKKAYAKAMSAKEVDADPVLNAQDVPSKPFKAEKPAIKDTTATVVLVTSFGKDKHQVTATLKKVDGVWLLESVK
ncbi:MAG TPA: hypothetical protein VG796_28495 [Verrucomicrobiales bacterium]|jgi:hypothetical protein|nr:hypothetical protein [Verrucomicrobiales bacterium]